jgi:hypothetical protein
LPGGVSRHRHAAGRQTPVESRDENPAASAKAVVARGPKRVRRSAVTWLGTRSETMSSGLRCARTAERREKVGDLRRDGRPRERRLSPRARMLRRAVRRTRRRRKLSEGPALEAHGSCAVSIAACGACGQVPGEEEAQESFGPPRGLNRRAIGTEPPRGAERPEGERRRPPSFPAATVCVGPAAWRMPRRCVGRWEGRCRERQEGIGRREASRLLGWPSSVGSNPKSASGMKQARRAGRGASRQEGESPWRRNVPGVETPGQSRRHDAPRAL